eukprot:18929-Rhodomonas_salina.5
MVWVLRQPVLGAPDPVDVRAPESTRTRAVGCASHLAVVAEVLDHFEGRREMVLARERARGAFEKAVEIVLSLRAKVVDDELVRMPQAEEAPNFLCRVPIEPFFPLSWEAHGDDVFRDVGQVEVEAICAHRRQLPSLTSKNRGKAHLA